nr:hypothetical protein [Tanacetum cinerariifolium]
IEKAAPSPTEVFSPAARKIRSQRPPRKTLEKSEAFRSWKEETYEGEMIPKRE